MREAISPRGRIRRWTLALACVLAPCRRPRRRSVPGAGPALGHPRREALPHGERRHRRAKRVTFGVPFTRGSLPPAALAKVRVLKGRQRDPGLRPGPHALAARQQSGHRRPVRPRGAHPDPLHVRGGLSPAPRRSPWSGARRRAPRTSPRFTNPRTAWHLVTTGSFVAADNVFEPDVYAVLPKAHLTQGPLRLGRALPFDDSVTEARSDPAVMDATEHWPGFLEQEHAPRTTSTPRSTRTTRAVTPANRCPYKTDSEPWLYDRPVHHVRPLPAHRRPEAPARGGAQRAVLQGPAVARHHDAARAPSASSS